MQKGRPMCDGGGLRGGIGIIRPVEYRRVAGVEGGIAKEGGVYICRRDSRPGSREVVGVEV